MAEAEQPDVVDPDSDPTAAAGDSADPTAAGGAPGEADAPDPGLSTGLPPRFEAWRRRSAAGAILTGIGLGLKQVFEVERDEPAIIMQASGDPPTDLSVEAELGGILPADNVVKIRPWLLGNPTPDISADLRSAKAADSISTGGTASDNTPPEGRHD